ncbi:hypothetical protein [Pseudomonas sp. PIC25]|uniref:hypothetical protein n=1 Tax=Pseudomonas sp. PIC25 TaxID=1958773 RepID=UPI001179E5D7|nr:hypothetical protein [Pseudomonas sp. PIC25]
MKNWITSHLPLRTSYSHHPDEAGNHAKTATNPVIDKLESNLQELHDLKNALTMLSNPRNKHSLDPVIQQLSVDAGNLLQNTRKVTENADAIVKQLKDRKLKPDHAGPHHQLISNTEVLVAQWQDLKTSYDAYTSSNRGH